MSNSRITLHLDAYTGMDRPSLLPSLLEAINGSGAWVLQRSCLSPTSTCVEMEFQAQALPELYGTLVGKGLELTRSTHMALTECCNTSRCLGHAGQSRIIAARLGLHFERSSRVGSAPERCVLLKPAFA